MKTLYITDLDGTLLNSNQQISEKSTAIINKLIDEGMLFSVATARSVATAVPLIEKIKVNLPIILMNGVFVYDIKKGCYLKVNSFDKATVNNIIDIIEKHNVTCFVYAVNDTPILQVYHKELTQKQQAYYNERVSYKGKKFTKIDEYKFDSIDVVYFTIIDSYYNLKHIYDDLIKISEINVAFYADVYKNDTWWLEISSDESAKQKGVAFLKEYLNVDRIVSFGDNNNDIEMLRSSDYSYAVGNANDKVKKSAKEVIGKCDEDSVALTLERVFK